eukprot:6214837-Pleurochrysis_carterae.AAC.1
MSRMTTVTDAVFALRSIQKLEPLDLKDTLAAHRRAMNNHAAVPHAHVKSELDAHLVKLQEFAKIRRLHALQKRRARDQGQHYWPSCRRLH